MSAGRRTLRPRGILREAWHEIPSFVGTVPGSADRVLSSPYRVWEAVRDVHDAPQEHAIVLCLNARNVLIGRFVVGIGTVNRVDMAPREVFRGAIAANAAAVIIVHNHPSGDTKPSRNDVTVTAQIRDAGELLGIPVLDHVIVGRAGYTSFADSGWSPPTQ